MLAVVILITASDGCSIRGSATFSTATSNAPLYTTAFIPFLLWPELLAGQPGAPPRAALATRPPVWYAWLSNDLTALWETSS